MQRFLPAMLVVLSTFQPVTAAESPGPRSMSAPIVFFDIAGTDTAQLASFYRNVFAWDVQADGRVQVPAAPLLSGLIRKDPADKFLYLGVEDINATLEKVVAHGGRIDAPRYEVPGVVILGLFRDPAGNRLGLVEMREGKPKVP